MGKLVDLTGQKFGRLLVTRMVEARTKSKKTQYEVACDCGQTAIVIGAKMTSGHTQSCGCLMLELNAARTLIDITGQTFGRLTVLRLLDKRTKHGGTRYEVQCSCGVIKAVQATSMKSGKQLSCGCGNRERLSRETLVDITGQKFGRLTAIRLLDERTPAGKTKYQVRCECGTVKVVTGGQIRSGKTQSCGCHNRETTANRNLEQGVLAAARRATWADLYGKDGLNAFDLRRLRIEINGGQEPWTRAEIFERDAGICHLCLNHVGDSPWDIDHIHPIALGGQDRPGNVAVAHASANRGRPKDEYLGVKYCMACGPVGHPLSDHDAD